MSYLHLLLVSLREMYPGVLIWSVVPLVPFMLAERLWPIDTPPRWRDYGFNVALSLSTAYLSLPLGILAALWSEALRHAVGWKPVSITFHALGAVPGIGPGLELVAMIFVPLFIHDFWFYWSHRLEHRWGPLWALHRIHHSDECMNVSTWARDHFLQATWRSFFSIFTLGLIVDLDLTEAGKAALYSNLFLTGLSMFYHSAIRVRLAWLDAIVVTPQVHRIHHGADPAYHNKNFADALPLFDIVFGTYLRPLPEEFPATGVGAGFPAPRSPWSAQWSPLAAATRKVWGS